MSRVVAAVLVVGCVTLGCGRIGFLPSVTSGDGGNPSDGWWNPSWRYREALVVNATQVAADLSEFPVLVSLDDPELAAHAASDGSDIVFVTASNQQLAHELDVYATSPPTLIAWVALPTVSSTTDTTFYVYYGNPAPPALPDPHAVWTNGFTSVYHFGDGTTLDVDDSAGTNDAVANSAVAAAGWIGGASEFDGGAGMTSNSAGVDATASAYNTVTFWMNYGLPYGNAPFVFHSTATDTSSVYDLWVEADGCFGFNTGNGDVLGSTEAGLAGHWVYVAAVFYNGVPDAAHNSLYLDGVIQPLSMCDDSTPNSETAADTTIYWGGDLGYQMTGLIDEGRVAHVARPSAWIQTEYNNQVAPATFITAGPEQTLP